MLEQERVGDDPSRAPLIWCQREEVERSADQTNGSLEVSGQTPLAKRYRNRQYDSRYDALRSREGP